MSDSWVVVAKYPAYQINRAGVVRRARDGFVPSQHVAESRHRNGRVQRYYKVSLHDDDGWHTVTVHRMLALAFIPNPENKRDIDHVNGDSLDNRLENLRWATRSENNRNRGASRDNTSGFKGVHAHGERWQVKIAHEGRTRCLGTYDDPETAAKVYDAVARVLHGTYAVTNFLLESE